MANEEIIKDIPLGSESVERIIKNPIPDKICVMRMNESGTGSVTITEKNIKHTSEFIVNLFEECPKP